MTEMTPEMIYGGGRCYYICIVPVKEHSLTHTIQIFFWRDSPRRSRFLLNCMCLCYSRALASPPSLVSL